MIKIEKAKVKDIAKIQEVFYKTWLVTYPNKEVGITIADVEEKYKDRFSEQAIEKRKKDILNISKNELFLVAKDKEVVIGACKLKKEDEYNELGAIYVLPDYQRNGIGKMFWDRAMEFFDDKKDIIVHVATYNEKAINFYKKMGFVDTGKRFAEEKFRMPISGSCIPEMEMIIKRKVKK